MNKLKSEKKNNNNKREEYADLVGCFGCFHSTIEFDKYTDGGKLKS